MSTVFTFPGQGSQFPGMLHHLPDHPCIRTTLEEASQFLGKDVLLLDTEKELESTTAVQLSLLISSVASGRALVADGVHPNMVAGHSVGVFGAAVIAEVLDFTDALALVKLRGELMEEAYPLGYGMGVVIGMTEKQLTSMVNQVKSPSVFLANVNSPFEITISGDLEGIEAVLALARKEGARQAKLLNVNVPSHCPLLAPISAELTSALNNISLRRPTIPYVGNHKVRLLRDSEAIRKDLAVGVAFPVRWYDMTTLLFELGTKLFIEMSPGNVLTNLIKGAFPCVRPISIDDHGIEAAIVLANREK